MLKIRCSTPTDFAALFLPAIESSVGTTAPIFCPNTMYSAESMETMPCCASACRIPTVADELCITAVIMKPLMIPASLPWDAEIIDKNAGLSLR